MTEEQYINDAATDAQQSTISKPTKHAISYFGQLGILLGLIGAGLVLGSIIGAVVWLSISHGNLSEIEKNFLKPENANAAKFLQLIVSFCMFFLPAYFFSLIISKKPLRYIGFNSKLNYKQILLVAAMAVVALILSGALAELNQIIPISKSLAAKFKQMEDQYAEQVMAMANMKNIGDYFFTLIVIAVAPAIFEEVLFRGGLQKLLINWTNNAWVGIIITSIIFSAIHFSYYGFLSRAALGIILGLIFYLSKNIWLNILLHFLNNGISVTALYLSSRKKGITKESMNDDTFPLYYGLIAVILLIVLFNAFKKESNKLIINNVDEGIRSFNNNPFANE